jgi:aerotaxis receptor
MPKIVFKALWDTILAGKPICAYVKNLAKDGSYYWVFATVIPIGDDFLSVRMKPTTDLKTVVENLYKELLSVEKLSGVEASLQTLGRALNSLGLADYNSFVLAAISAELVGRYELQTKEPKKNININNSSIQVNPRHLASVRESLFKIFKIINKLSNLTKSISGLITKIAEISKSIEFSALNIIIEAERLGNNGWALAVVAQHISVSAAEAKKLNSNINMLVTKMLGGLGEFRSTQLEIALSTIQIEMLSCFILQRHNDPLSTTEENFNKNVLLLITLIEKSLKNAEPVILALNEDTKGISAELEQTSQILMSLDFIQKTGSIESARLLDASVFVQLFLAIINLIKESKNLYIELSEIINNNIKKDVLEAIEEYKMASKIITWLNKNNQ